MKERKLLILICIITALIIGIISLDCGVAEHRVFTGTSQYVILIDPGHGGMDGGASGSDGTLEKDINLAISRQLEAAAEQYRCRTVLTRENGEWLCRTDEGSIRSRKTADLAARREMIEKYAPDIMVSIHLNSFKEDPAVKGAQVFYPGDCVSDDVLDQCRQLAETMQSEINETLQKENPRTAMIRDGVFIFRNAETPVIIIECGFLSNHDEMGKLKTVEYQQELAQCIMAGIVEFAHIEKRNPIEFIDSLR